MSKNQESNIEVIDDINNDTDTTLIEDESHSDSDEQSKEEKEDNTTSNKSKNVSNKSNWKKMQKKLREMESRLAQYEGDNDDEEYDEEEDDNETQENSGVDEIKLTRFLMKNPEAIEMEDDIIKACKRFPDMSFSEALTFIKANNSISETHKDFSTKTKSTPKKLSTLTDEEALSYFKGNDKGFLNWQRQTGRIKS